MLPVLFGISILLATSFLLLLRRKNKARKILVNVPGPKPNFFLGNIGDFIFLPKHKYFDHLMKYIKRFGPTFKVYIGPIKVGLVTADEALIEYVLTKTIDKSDYYKLLDAWLGTGLLTGTGIKWKKHRRMLTPAFHFSILENAVEIFESVGDIFIEKLRKEVNKSSVDIFPLVTLCTLDIICETAMGTKLNAQENQESEYVKSVKTMCSIFADRVTTALPPILYPLTRNYYREKKAIKVLHGYTDGIIENRMSKLKENDSSNTEHMYGKTRLAFLDILLKSTIDGEPLSRTDIREEVDTFMFEGHDTSATAISFILYSLAVNPEVQEKAYQEQKQLFHENFETAKPAIAQLQEMKYLEMIIKESLRIYPSVPFLARKFPVDKQLEWEGIVFPKGLNILLSLYFLHRNPKNFPDPEKFDPDRFADTTGANPFIYSPFSAGPRNCIGQKFAMLEMKSIVSKVLRRFKLLPSIPEHEFKLMPDIVLASATGICLALKER